MKCEDDSEPRVNEIALRSSHLKMRTRNLNKGYCQSCLLIGEIIEIYRQYSKVYFGDKNDNQYVLQICLFVSRMHVFVCMLQVAVKI